LKYKNVLSIDYDFSVIGLGCRSFGGKDYWESFDEKNATEVINESIDRGINFFDVAPTYGNGFAESFVGKVLAKEKKRDKVFIATKCGLVSCGNGTYKYDLSHESIFSEIDASLKRLNTDYIDLYQCIFPDPHIDIEETMETLVFLKRLGKIKHIGVTNFSYEQIRNALRVAKVNAVQGYYNIFNRNSQTFYNAPLNYMSEKDLFRICYEENMAFFAYSGLFHGLLTDGFSEKIKNDYKDIRKQDPKVFGENGKVYIRLINDLNDFSKKIGKSLNQVALNFLINKDMVTSTLVGCSNKEQLISNLGASDFKLSDDESAEIERLIKAFLLETGEAH